MELETLRMSVNDIIKIIGVMFLVGGALNTVFLIWLRSRYVPRSFIFCPRDGTPIYRTVDDCKEMEKKLEKERRERDKRVEKAMQEKVDAIEASNKRFTKNLLDMFKTQTAQISEVVKNAVG